MRLLDYPIQIGLVRERLSLFAVVKAWTGFSAQPCEMFCSPAISNCGPLSVRSSSQRAGGLAVPLNRHLHILGQASQAVFVVPAEPRPRLDVRLCRSL